VSRAKPPGLPHGKVRTAAQLLRNPDMLAHLSVFDEQRTDLLHWQADLGGWLLYNLPVVPPPLGRIRTAMHTIDDVVRGVIDARPSGGGDGDLLDLLLAAGDETGESLSRTQVRDEVVTLVLAGHETTANGLAWFWYLLAQHPEARARMQEEGDDVLGGRTPSAADADRLTWTTACFQEAMRLYPPAWVLEREAIADDELDGWRIPKRSTVIFPVFLIHRDPRWWPNADAFDPTRFIGERAAQSHRGAYLPFGAGRRACVGANFALMEATLIAAMLAQRFTLDLVEGAPAQPDATVTLRPRYGLPMTMHRRRALV
jgi:cytochrome P450